MKVETTIKIEADLLQAVDNAAKDFDSRSEIFEKALRDFLPKLNKNAKKQLSDEEELKILNRMAVKEREEILENLEYQTDL